MAAGKEYQLTTLTLYNGARDDEGGIWVRIDSMSDHRILMSAVKKQLKNHEAATNTLSALDEDAPQHIDYIKSALERIKTSVIGALPASEQLHGTPIGRAIQEALKLEVGPDELEPTDPELTDDALFKQLSAIGGDPTIEVLKKWSPLERREVYRWARAIGLTEGGARRDLAVPQRPALVPIEWFQQSMKAAIEKGERDATSLEIIHLSAEQIEYWRAQGPWRVVEQSVEIEDEKELDALKELDDDKLPANIRKAKNGFDRIEFAIEWSEAVDVGTTPEHSFVYDTTEQAALVVARMNRRYRLDRAEAGKPDPIATGEPFPFNEALLTSELQTSVIDDMNEMLRSSGDKKTIVAKDTLPVTALRTWYRTGPWEAHRVEEAHPDDPSSPTTARYRVVRPVHGGKFVGALTTYDIYEAHTRAALWNRAEFQTAELWNEGGAGRPDPTSGETPKAPETPPAPTNEAQDAVEKGAAKKSAKKKGGGGKKKR
jgi:hypothetical protein